MKNLIVTALSLIVVCFNASAFKDEIHQVHSRSMNKDIPTTVVIPDSYGNDGPFPVVYLLHGYSDNHRTWVERTDVESLADEYGIIIVMPDGGYDSWYFDSGIVSDYNTKHSSRLNLLTISTTDSKLSGTAPAGR